MCATSRMIFRPLPFFKLPYFLRLLPPPHGLITFITRHSVIQRRSRPNYSVHAGCYSPIQGLCLCWPLRLDTPCPWNYYPCHLSSRRDDVRLSCLLTQALMPLESIANLNAAIYSYLITLHDIFFYLSVENRIFNKFKEFDLC